MHNHKPQKLKILLLSVILITLGITVVVFWGYRRIKYQNDTPGEVANKKASISIAKIHQTATRNGIKEWSLEAASADVMHSENQAVLKDLKVTFFLKDNTRAYLTADQGILHMDSNDIQVKGNVLIKKDNYHLKTESLFYRHDRRILSSKVPVKIIDGRSILSGDTMTHDLNTQKTILKGNIKGTFSENFKL